MFNSSVLAANGESPDTDKPGDGAISTPLPAAAVVQIPSEVLEELDQAVSRDDAGALALAGDVAALPGLRVAREWTREVRAELDQGSGFVLLDRVPVARYATKDLTSIASVLAALAGRIVDQKWQGTRLYEVRNTGQSVGYGVRRSITDAEQDFHTDGAWLPHTPAVVGLFCIAQAKAGGGSSVVNLAQAHDRLAEQQPKLLERLYQPFYWDRQAEHAADETPVTSQPVFSATGGALTARCYNDYVTSGHRLAGKQLDDDGRAALEALRDAIKGCDQYNFRLEPGQFQLVNNHRFAHARGAFTDGDGAGRHILRLWMREVGGAGLEG